MIGARHHGAAAGLLDAGRDRLRIGRNHHRSDVGGLRPAHHMDDHRLAGDIGERLAGKPGRSHAGRNEDREYRPSVCQAAVRELAAHFNLVIGAFAVIRVARDEANRLFVRRRKLRRLLAAPAPTSSAEPRGDGLL